MNDKKALIIVSSTHHNNTFKIAEILSKELNAKIKRTDDVKSEELSDYELIGFGSGIYNGKHHKSLFELINNLKTQNNKKVFIFSTSTIPLLIMHKPLKEKLIGKGFKIIGDFYCKGFMNYSFTKFIFGGLNKGRPNLNDFNKAKEFAKKIKLTII